MKVLLIDNIDSFTWNLAQLIRSAGAECHVVRNDEVTVVDIRRMSPDRIVLSPGPGGPADSKASLDAVKEFYASIPMLGVCLGHQCLAHVFGGPAFVGRAQTVMHGKTSKVFHDGKDLFQKIASPFTAARYHSLIVKRVPNDFVVTAWTGTQNKPDVIMAMRHESLPVFGVQFHPESFLTEHGGTLMKNFLSVRS